MAKTNILHRLNSGRGTFYTFSQYTHDMTKWYNNPSYKCTPSKMLCMNLNLEGADLTLPEHLQNYFENKLTILRDTPNLTITTESENEYTYNSKLSTSYLIKALEKGNFITINEDLSCNNILAYEDINIQSYNEKDGVGYGEIYCYIPPETKKISNYKFSLPTTDEYTIESTNSTIEGWTSTEIDFIGIDAIKDDTNSYSTTQGYELTTDYTDSTDDLFSFNAILVLYDVQNGDDIITNLPLGIYITGTNNNSKINKFVSNSEIYEQGTAFGVRICTRMINTINSTAINEVNATPFSENDYNYYQQAIAQLIKTYTKFDEVLEQNKSYINNINEHLEQFKQNKTNVPYIRKIDGVSYWFVNGRNTNELVHPSITALETKINELEQRIINLENA